jgi:Spy/CpxP family protein refolding chaperone
MKRSIRLFLAATCLATASAASAQTTTGSQSSTPTTGDVSAGTYGSGTTDANSVGVSGGGNATAADGGTATTDSRAKFNENMARQRSVATARDDDERARSMTNTHVRKDGQVRSRSMSIYKERGEKPVIDRQTSTSGR